MLTALNCESSFLFRQDEGTGRCRLKLEDLNSLGIKLGNIVKINLFPDENLNTSVDLLCVAWLNDAEYCDSGVIIVDDTVRIGHSQFQTWSQLRCKIVEVIENRVCTSLQVQIVGGPRQSETHDVSSVQYACLPVAKDAYIKANAKMNRPFITAIRRALPMSPCVVSPFSLLAHNKSPVSISTSSSSTDISDHQQQDALGISVNTQLVEDLLRKLVIPATRLSSLQVPHGALLLGPPGVGKTYSVRAVQARCKGWCDVRIHELSVPDLLSRDDPLRQVEAVFANIFELAPTATPSKGAGMQSPVDRSSSSSSSPSSSSPLLTDRQRTHGDRKVKEMVYTPIRKSQLVQEGGSGSSPVSLSSARVGSPFSFSHAISKSPTSPSPHSRSATPAKSFNEPQVHFVVIDELDALGKLGSQSEEQLAIVSWLCSWLDRQGEELVKDTYSESAPYICLIGTTNRPEDVDSRLRRGGRMGIELEVHTLRQDRVEMLRQSLCAHVATSLQSEKLSIADIDEAVDRVVDRLGGYVAADLAMLVSEAITQWTNDSCEDARTSLIRCLEAAALRILPSALKGARISVPKLTFEDVIGCTDAKRKLSRILSFADPSKRELISRYKLSFPGGALLHGPPGNSKTRLISAAAAVYGLPVISLSAADVYSPYVGDAEAEIRKAFRLARQSAPCVLMMDEVDALVTDRGIGGSGSGSGSRSASAESRVLATLLNEMDGVSENKADSSSSSGNSSSGQLVYVLATTNRLGSIDKALLRKGRFHHIIYVPTPNEEEVRELIKYFGRKFSLSTDIVQQLCDKVDTEFRFRKEAMSGADIENMCREEAMKVIRHEIESSKSISERISG